MTASFYHKLYRYRERPGGHRKEDFLSEILAQCLDTDERFRVAFLQACSITAPPHGLISVETQVPRAPYGRTDIELLFDKHHYVIENKLDHEERPKQLDDYRKAIGKEGEDETKQVIFLTKNHLPCPVFARPIRWHEVAALITEDMGEFTKELKKFLREENMDIDMNFNETDTQALLNIQTAIRKMDGVLNQAEHFFAEKFGAWSQYASRSTRLLRYNQYACYKELWFGDQQYWITAGFFLREPLRLGLTIWIPKQRQGVQRGEIGILKAGFEQALKSPDWFSGDYKEGLEFGRLVAVGDLLKSGGDHSIELSRRLKQFIGELYAVKEGRAEWFVSR